jgi:hypothetical protein
MNEFVRYYYDDRTHLGLNRQTSGSRRTAGRTNATSEVISTPSFGGPRHRYQFAA